MNMIKGNDGVWRQATQLAVESSFTRPLDWGEEQPTEELDFSADGYHGAPLMCGSAFDHLNRWEV
jgi:hypothetical protein